MAVLANSGAARNLRMKDIKGLSSTAKKNAKAAKSLIQSVQKFNLIQFVSILRGSAGKALRFLLLSALLTAEIIKGLKQPRTDQLLTLAIVS